MFKIRKIHDANMPINQKAVEQVQKILKEQFHLIHGSEIDKLPDMLNAHPQIPVPVHSFRCR